jgi:hypothetical protein
MAGKGSGLRRNQKNWDKGFVGIRQGREIHFHSESADVTLSIWNSDER